MKIIIIIIISLLTLICNLCYSQVPNLVSNGDFSESCGTGVNSPPCGWNYRNRTSHSGASFDAPIHIGNGVNGFFYTTLGTCIQSPVKNCNGRNIVTVDETFCPPHSLGTPTACNTPSTITEDCMYLPPGYGIGTRGGIETNVGTLCAGSYTLSFDVMINMPAANSAFALQVFLNNTQNDKDEEVFKLLNSDGSNMTPGVWRHFDVDVIIDESDDHKFEWLSFINERCNFGLLATTAHSVFLDNVSFYSNCTKELGACSPYLGEANPIWVYTQNSQTICVTNLNNIQHCKLEIINDLGQTLRTIEIDDPSSKICWDEKTDGGQIVGALHLTARLTAETGCCTKIETYDFTRVKNEVVHNGDFTDYSSQIKLDATNCCNPDIIIENENIADMRQYIGPVKIRIGPNVVIKNTADVYLQAGVTIDIVEPLEIEAGAVFEATIEDCSPPKFKVSPNTITTSKNDSLFELEENDLAMLDNWYLMPNPARDNISVNLSLMSLEYPNVTLTMYDYTGREISTKQILSNNLKPSFDISNLSSGLFYITLKEREQILATKKFIKQ